MNIMMTYGQMDSETRMCSPPHSFVWEFYPSFCVLPISAPHPHPRPSTWSPAESALSRELWYALAVFIFTSLRSFPTRAGWRAFSFLLPPPLPLLLYPPPPPPLLPPLCCNWLFGKMLITKQSSSCCKMALSVFSVGNQTQGLIELGQRTNHGAPLQLDKDSRRQLMKAKIMAVLLFFPCKHFRKSYLGKLRGDLTPQAWVTGR